MVWEQLGQSYTGPRPAGPGEGWWARGEGLEEKANEMNHWYPVCSEQDTQVAGLWAGPSPVVQNNEWPLGVEVSSAMGKELGRMRTMCRLFSILREDAYPQVWETQMHYEYIYSIHSPLRYLYLSLFSTCSALAMLL